MAEVPKCQSSVVSFYWFLAGIPSSSIRVWDVHSGFTFDFPFTLWSLRERERDHMLLLLGSLIWWTAIFARKSRRAEEKMPARWLKTSHLPGGPSNRHEAQVSWPCQVAAEVTAGRHTHSKPSISPLSLSLNHRNFEAFANLVARQLSEVITSHRLADGEELVALSNFTSYFLGVLLS